MLKNIIYIQKGLCKTILVTATVSEVYVPHRDMGDDLVALPGKEDIRAFSLTY